MKEKKVTEKKVTGGSKSPIQVKKTPKRKVTTEEEIVEEVPIEEVVTPETTPEVESIPPEVALVNEALIEASVKMIGKTVELITRIPEMNFESDEIEQLKRLWTPLLPTMNPVLAAITGTLVIFAGKATIYFSLRKERPTREQAREAKEAVSE